MLWHVLGYGAPRDYEIHPGNAGLMRELGDGSRGEGILLQRQDIKVPVFAPRGKAFYCGALCKRYVKPLL